jgi:hypothetical protein
MCVFVDNANHAAVQEMATPYTNVAIMEKRVSLDTLSIQPIINAKREIQGDNGSLSTPLPANRNLEKDTLEYVLYTHSRFEWMEETVRQNPFHTSHFAWMDFNSAVDFDEHAMHTMRQLMFYPFPKEKKVMYVPGCWPVYDKEKESFAPLHQSIYWRFCGSFLLADAQGIAEFAELHRTHLPEYVETFGLLTWEVNFWAWMEYKGVWKPVWYKGDHNARLVHLLGNVSADNYACRLLSSPTAEKRELTSVYPEIPPYLPGSAAYLRFAGKDYLNTRFVNYWMYPNGYYLFHGADNIIGNRNFLSELRGDDGVPATFEEMGSAGRLFEKGETKLLPEWTQSRKPISEGLEDIRLFAPVTTDARANPKFIATNVNYSPVAGSSRMVVGTYNLESHEFEDCAWITPPDPNSWCEKNWVPVCYEGAEHFIYKWSPLEIGRVNESTKQLEIVQSYAETTKTWVFSKLRGSTVFTEYNEEYWVGLTHFSEDHAPRHYFHVLVLLERETLRPVRYSRVFYFEGLGVEFCIGMRMLRDANAEKGDCYQFWVSRFDRDPLCVTVSAEDLLLENEV